MSQTSLLEKILRFLKDDYLILEIWSEFYKGDELKQYTNNILKSLKKSYPEIQIGSKRRSGYVETRNCPYISFPGYIIKMAPNLDVLDLKKKCIELEKNESGNRISDIDIYYKNKKISRKML